MTTYDVIVIGAGMTGLTASKALARRGLAVANIEGAVFGGLITNVNALEGEFEGSGADLASTLMMEAGDLGCTMLSEMVAEVGREGSNLQVITEAGTYAARSLIVASGARLKRLGVPGETELEYKGVSRCADCDGPMQRGQHVVVVGGGDSALQESLVLSEYCASVRIVCSTAEPTAHPRWREAAAARTNISVLSMCEVTAIEGGSVVEAVRVRSNADGSIRTLPATGIFVYVGLEPSTAFLPAETARDAAGAVVVGEALETSIENVFAGGAVRAGYGGLLSDAVRDARIAADAVARRLRA
jgi:thioredoxin reductase (NADPH)